MKTDVVEQDGLLELGKFHRAGLLPDLLIAIQIFEDFLRCPGGLLEDVVNAGEALHWFVQHEKRDDKAGEFSGGHRSTLDVLAGVGEQSDDGDGSEEFDQRRRERLLRDIAKVAGFETTRSEQEAIGLNVLGAEGLHYLMAADGFLQDLVQLGGVILRAARGAADAAAD